MSSVSTDFTALVVGDTVSSEHLPEGHWVLIMKELHGFVPRSHFYKLKFRQGLKTTIRWTCAGFLPEQYIGSFEKKF